MRRQVILAASLALGTLCCRQEMYDQPRYKPLGKSDFFSDNRQSRPAVEGTVARGALHADSRLYTGKSGDALLTVYPLPVTAARIERGRERYDIYCAPCHDRTGAGNGMVVQRGYRQPPSFHIDRLRQVAIGHFYDVISNGFGAMPDYAAQLTPEDRWAVVAYVKALQLSQGARVDDVPAERRADLDRAPAAPDISLSSPEVPTLSRSLPNPKPGEGDRPGPHGKPRGAR